jgi:hypothetical protein
MPNKQSAAIAGTPSNAMTNASPAWPSPFGRNGARIMLPGERELDESRGRALVHPGPYEGQWRLAQLLCGGTMIVIDTHSNVSGSLALLKAKGVGVVGRYYSSIASKRLTRAELELIDAAGFQIFTIFEDDGDSLLTADMGRCHAQIALEQAAAVGQPHGSAIYFALSGGLTTQHLNDITEYVSGLKERLRGLYKLGVYADALICAALIDAGVCDYTWLSASRGFDGSKQVYASRRWTLAQDPHIDQNWAGLSVNLNDAAADIGAFRLSDMAAPTRTPNALTLEELQHQRDTRPIGSDGSRMLTDRDLYIGRGSGGGFGGSLAGLGGMGGLAGIGNLSRRRKWDDDPKTEPLDVSAFAPDAAVRASETLVQIYIHHPDQASEAAEQAREADYLAVRHGVATLTTQVMIGQRLVVVLAAPGALIESPSQYLVWRGEPRACQFVLTVPSDSAIDTLTVRVTVLVDDVPIGSLRFHLPVTEQGQSNSSMKIVGDESRRYSIAFLSHAKHDRLEVLKRAQLLRAVNIGFFQDFLTIEPGKVWEKYLYEAIDRCDLFLLFWSKYAAASKWVLRETERALARKGGKNEALPDIIPIVLEGPPIPPVPDSLKHIQITDWFTWVMRAEEAAALEVPAVNTVPAVAPPTRKQRQRRKKAAKVKKS